MLNSKGDHGEETMADEIRKEVRARWDLQVLRDSCALMEKLHRVILSLSVRIPRVEDTKELFQEGGICLDMVHNVDLVEEDQRVEDREGWIVENPSQDHVFQVLQPPSTPNLSSNKRIFDWDHLLVPRLVRKILPVIRFVGREFRIV